MSLAHNTREHFNTMRFLTSHSFLRTEVQPSYLCLPISLQKSNEQSWGQLMSWVQANQKPKGGRVHQHDQDHIHPAHGVQVLPLDKQIVPGHCARLYLFFLHLRRKFSDKSFFLSCKQTHIIILIIISRKNSISYLTIVNFCLFFFCYF